MRLFRLIQIASLFFLFLLPLKAFGQSSVDDCARKQEERRVDKRGDFASYSFPSVDEAIKDPDTWWDFITDPATPYIERRSAATRGVAEFPFKEFIVRWLPRVLQSTDSLDAEFTHHHFGLRLPNCWHLAYIPDDDFWRRAEKKRMILGETWSLPDELSEYPLTMDEEMGAPWPWQVREALKDVATAVYAQLHDPLHREELLQAAMELPVDTDEQALIFVRITNYFSLHHKSVPIMGRWYRIGLDPKKPTAAAMVAADAGAAGRLWQDPQSQAIADTILIDIINMTSDQDLRFKAMYAYMGLHQVDPLERSHGKKVINSPTAIKLITEKLLDPQGGDEWSRVYYFALVISALVDDPPITYEQIKEDVHDDEGRQNYLQKIGKWYRIHKADLEKAALEEGIELEKIRALLRDGK